MAPEEDVKLLSIWASPFAIRAILALEAKGVKYEILEQIRGQKSQLLLESNPVHKMIPVLLHNGKAISESLIIVAYVDEAWPAKDGSCTRPAFFPQDPFGRAIAYFWADFVDKKIIDVALRSVTTKGEQKETAVKELYDNILTLESGLKQLKANPFFNGSSIGYADISLAPFAAFLPLFLELGGIQFPTAEETPHLHKFLTAIREHPAAKVAFPEEQKLMAFIRNIFQ